MVRRRFEHLEGGAGLSALQGALQGALEGALALHGRAGASWAPLTALSRSLPATDRMRLAALSRSFVQARWW